VVSGGKYHEVFLQGNLGRTGIFIDRAASLRLAGFRYYDFGQWDGDGNARPAPSRHWGFFLEPAYTFRLGYKHLKAESQIGVSLPLYQAEGLEHQWMWISVGAGVDVFAD
jgi:hypothetical protein